MVNKYRKKPIVIEAIQYTEGNIDECKAFCDKLTTKSNFSTQLVINTLEGAMDLELNAYIIKGIQGEFYPCKGDIFEASYEKVD